MNKVISIEGYSKRARSEEEQRAITEEINAIVERNAAEAQQRRSVSQAEQRQKEKQLSDIRWCTEQGRKSLAWMWAFVAFGVIGNVLCVTGLIGEIEALFITILSGISVLINAGFAYLTKVAASEVMEGRG